MHKHNQQDQYEVSLANFHAAMLTPNPHPFMTDSVSHLPFSLSLLHACHELFLLQLLPLRLNLLLDCAVH